MSLESRMDDLLVQITSQIGQGCPGLLDQLFGFLQRRTDFYYEMEPNDKMGFPPGVTEQMVFQHYKKYKDIHHKKFPPKEGLMDIWKEYELQKQAAMKAHKENMKNQQDSSKTEEIKESAEGSEKKTLNAEEKAKIMNENIQKDLQSAIQKQAPKQVVPPREVPKEMKDISTYNGDSTEKYKWSQELNEIIVQVDLPRK